MAVDDLDLCYSRGGAKASLAFEVVALGLMSIGCLAVALVAGFQLGLMLGAVVAVLSGMAMVRTRTRVGDTEPVVTLNRHGIRDRRLGPTPIQWMDLAHVELGFLDDAYGLVLQFRDARQARRHFRSPSVPRAQGRIDLEPLSCRDREVLALAQRHLQRASTERQRILDEQTCVSS